MEDMQAHSSDHLCLCKKPTTIASGMKVIIHHVK